MSGSPICGSGRLPPGGSMPGLGQGTWQLAEARHERPRLLPACRQRRLAGMACTPIAQGRVVGHAVLGAVAVRHAAAPAQVAPAWVVRGGGVCAIPTSGLAAHLRESRGVPDLGLSAEDLAALDEAFPPPGGPRSLAVL